MHARHLEKDPNWRIERRALVSEGCASIIERRAPDNGVTSLRIEGRALVIEGRASII